MAGQLRGFSSSGVGGSRFIAFNAANQVWNGAAFEAWNDTHVNTYLIIPTLLGTSGWAVADEPAGTAYFVLLPSSAIDPVSFPLTILDRGVIASGGGGGLEIDVKELRSK